MPVYEGGCHCKNLRIAFTTDLTPDQMQPRSCQCSFCIKHATGAISDPNGSLTITMQNPDDVSRYHIGIGISDFVICRNCGVYIGAYMPDDDGAYANVMAHILDDHARFTLPSVPVVRTSESESEKRARRRAAWTPAVILPSQE
jgi:hypothetical protein